MTKFRNALSYVLVAVFALITAINFQIFIFPNNFAPSGVDGILTMIQKLSGINMGYFALLANIPFVIWGAFYLKPSYLIKTAIYFVTFSLLTILFKYFPLPEVLIYTGEYSGILAPIAGGVIRGLVYVVTIKEDACSGGIDIIAAIVHKTRPYYNFMNIIFAINTTIAIASFFVYGFSYQPVICSIIYAFVTSTVTKSVQAIQRQSVRFEIITSDASEILQRIIGELGLHATIVDAHGAYTGGDKKMVICVTEKKNVPRIEDLLKEYDDAVAFESVIDNAILHRQ